MALVDGASAHAIPGLPGAGLALDAIHVAAMGIWIGGLAAFLFAPDRRFGPYAIGGLAVAIGSGLLLALAHLGSPSALVTTGYGSVLLVKVAVVAAAIVIAVLGRQRIEAWVSAVILALAAVLVSLPPPR
jgi:copper transport protein